MPRAGGESDKLGNRYEATWTVGRALDLLTGDLKGLVVEPFGADSLGVEFVAVDAGGKQQFHSVKRQRVGGDWSLAALCETGGGSRSVLSDLTGKLAADAAAGAAFVSSTGANQLRELVERAQRRSDASEFETDLTSSETHLTAFEKRILPLAGDWETAFNWLNRLRVVLIDEQSLREQVEQRIEVLLYRPDGSLVEAGTVRLLLADYILDHLGASLTGEALWAFLASKGYAHRHWAADAPLLKHVGELNNGYIEHVELELINQARIEREAATTVFEELHRPGGARHVVLAAAAGVGKSCAVAQLVDQLSRSGELCLVVRLDQHGDAHTTRELGGQLDLPKSPAVVLAGIADGRPCTLIIDQLDAVSQASGRNPQLWDVVAKLLREAEACPNMRVVVACREFDLQHDPRLRAFMRERAGLRRVPLELLSMPEVQAALLVGGVERELSARELEILRTPLHLLLFLESAGDQPEFGSASELFDRFWGRKQRAVALQVGGQSEWADAVGRLCEVMSERQALSIPVATLDKWPQTTAAMQSEHVLIVERSQVRFFHESFFDYAFARRFCADGRRLVELLHSGEQHLFRRGQVRQVLHYRRSHDRMEYLRELPSLLSDGRVRFHIKKVVLQWMGAVEDPSEEEWRILEGLIGDAALERHALVAVRNSLPWFDLLAKLGVVQAWLASDDGKYINRALWLLHFPEVREQGSAQVAALLAPYCGTTSDWNRRLRDMFRRQDAHHSREMKDLFLQLLDLDVWEDDGLPRRGDWWDCLYEAANTAPDFVVQAIAGWLDREIAKARAAAVQDVLEPRNHDHTAEHVILAAAAKAPLAYSRVVLPRFHDIVAMTALSADDKLQPDRTWLWRSCSSVMGTSEALLEGLVTALSELARTSPAEFEQLAATVAETSFESEAYVLLRSWSANPARYGDACIKFLGDDPRRLGVGYVSWRGEGSGQAAVSREAIQLCLPFASAEHVALLEQAVLAYASDGGEDDDREHWVWVQRLLLEAIGEDRLSKEGTARLHDLRARYPEQETAIPIKQESANFINSAVSAAEAEKYSDEQWLAAMEKFHYGWEERGPRLRDGSAVELSRLLEPRVRTDRRRFAALAQQMDDTIRPEYFDAILEGICGRRDVPAEEREADHKDFDDFPTADILAVIRRLHRLPNRPCGRSICHAFEAIADRSIPDADLEILRYYALDDPDPPKEDDDDSVGEHTHLHGFNSVRGTAARAISALLFADYKRAKLLVPVVEQMCADPSLAVRTCVFDALLPILNHDRDLAVALFLRVCDGAELIMDCQPFETFVRYAVSTHYAQLRPVLQQALRAKSPAAQTAASHQVCLAAFAIPEAETDAAGVRGGTEAMRKGAADVYSRNLSVSSLAQECARHLAVLFHHESEDVRDRAGSCFADFQDADFEQFQALLNAYIESPAFPSQHDDVLRRLEESTWQLPDVIIRLAERFIDACGADAGDLSTAAAGDAPTVAKLVMRLYNQSRDEEVRSRCLDLIDEMERLSFYGIGGELTEHDR